MTALRHLLRAAPTLLGIGLAEVVAYRAEFFIWILTTNLPLVNLVLWRAVAADGPVGRFGQPEFTAYFLGALVVRLITGSWVIWQLNFDIRNGTLAARLLRPMHPLLAYAAQHLAAIPMRILVVSPIVAILFATGGEAAHLSDPSTLAAFLLSLAGGWLLVFLAMVLIGTLAIWVESALSLYEMWFAIHVVLSGYLFPIELLPAAVRPVAQVLPFWFTLGLPVEILVGLHDRASLWQDIARQWLWVAAFWTAAALLWRAGQRRLVAYGG